MQLILDSKSHTQTHCYAVTKWCDAYLINGTYTLIVQRYTHYLMRHARTLLMQTHFIGDGYWLFLGNSHVYCMF